MSSQATRVVAKPQFSQNPKSIRRAAALLIVAEFFVGPLANVLWVFLMSQYSRSFRICWFVISSVVPTVVLLLTVGLIFSVMGGEEAARDSQAIIDSKWFGVIVYFGPIILLLPFMPYVYTLIWPLGRKYKL